jgi:microcompartment protein CcmL/EutN
MSLPINTTENNFVIYPNPTNDILNIELTTNNNQEYSIEVRDITGKLIKHEKKERNSKLTRLDLTHNNKGVYVVIIRNKDWIKSKIVIKM